MSSGSLSMSKSIPGTFSRRLTHSNRSRPTANIKAVEPE